MKAPIIASWWLTICVCSLYALQSYKTQPGQLLVDDVHRSTFTVNHGPPYKLIMFIHPRCPCTFASVHELDHIVRAANASLRIEVVAADTSDTELANIKSDLLAFARTIPHCEIRGETGGELQRFGACTSGHLVVFDSADVELFRGGITRARGHEGVSEGSRIVESILNGDTPEEHNRPVYGCPL